MKTTNSIARAVWGAVHPNGFDNRKMPFTEFWLHHSVTIAPDLLPPFTDDDEAVRTLERIGQNRFGGGISYTLPITPVGRVYEGHSLERRGAHTLNHNTVGAAICFIGNYSKIPPTPQQIEAAAKTMVLAHRMGAATRHTLNGGHRDVFASECPGDAAYGLIPTINHRANQLWLGGFGKTITPVRHIIATATRTITRAPLVVDGDLGPATIRQWQKVMGTPVDGVISKPSSLVMAVQRVVKVAPDGFLGAVTWRAIQRRLGVVADGVPGPITIKALQRRLNTGRF